MMKTNTEVKLVNDCYEGIKAYIDEHHGFVRSELVKTAEYAAYQHFMDELKMFDGHRVRIEFIANGQLQQLLGLGQWKQAVTGKICVVEKEGHTEIRFFENRSRTQYQLLDGGVDEGCYAVIIPQTISLSSGTVRRQDYSIRAIIKRQRQLKSMLAQEVQNDV